jgi:hypothetical protein
MAEAADDHHTPASEMNEESVGDIPRGASCALKLPGIARTFEGLAAKRVTRTGRMKTYLQEVLSAKIASRHESVIRQRLREARLNRQWRRSLSGAPAAIEANYTLKARSRISWRPRWKTTSTQDRSRSFTSLG